MIDTHVLLWMLATPEKLSPRAHRELDKIGSEVLVSAVSLYEIANKVRLGKLKAPSALLTQTEWTLARLSANLLPLSGQAALLGRAA